MALNRITGLGMIVLGSSMLLALACDSGGTTAAPGNGNTGGSGQNGDTGGTSSVTGNTGGASSVTGNTGGASTGNTGGTKASTGGSTSSTSQPAACVGLAVPTATGSISVASGYVTAGTYKGYGFTWVGENSIMDSTCVTPKCGDAGCSPAFGATALCGAGVVAADPDYNSIVGVGFNLNQAASGANTPATVAAGSSVTVGVSFDDASKTGNAAARIQLSVVEGGTEVSYCVEAGSWAPGSAVDITAFNTACWDDSGTFLAAGAEVVAVHVVVPSDSTAERPFGLCLTDFAM